jgi:hypothetical protein
MKNIAKILKDRRAITPVLSSLLLTVVAVAAMSIATTATYVITTNMRETMSERVAVEDVWFNTSTNSTSIYLRNVGKVAVTFSAVYINHTQSHADPYRLGIGEHGWLNVTETWETDNVYYIDIVTTRGNHFPISYKT